MQKILKIIPVIMICGLMCSCNTPEQRNPQLDTDPFENYHPWWVTNGWSTNVSNSITNGGH